MLSPAAAAAAPIASHGLARDSLASTSIASCVDGGGGCVVVKTATPETKTSSRLESIEMETKTKPRLYISQEK